MNSISLFALSLGLISLVISMKYINLYEKLNKHTKQLSVTCGSNNATSSAMISIQNLLDLSDSKFEQLLATNKDEILKLLQKSVSSPSITTTTSSITNAVVTNKSVESTQVPATTIVDTNKPKIVDNSTTVSTTVPDVVPSKKSDTTIQADTTTQPETTTVPTIKQETTKPAASTLTKSGKSGSKTTQQPATAPTTTSTKSKKPAIEKFENYTYKTISQRGVDGYNFTNIIKSRDTAEYSDADVGMDEDEMMHRTTQYINKFHDTKNINDVEPVNNFINKNWCLVNHDDKNYCFEIRKLEQCNKTGKVINNKSICNIVE